MPRPGRRIGDSLALLLLGEVGDGCQPRRSGLRARRPLIYTADPNSTPMPTLIASPPNTIGRASCRDRVCKYVQVSVGDVTFKKTILPQITDYIRIEYCNICT